MVLIVLCFGVDFCAVCFAPYVIADYWEIAAHSAYDIFHYCQFSFFPPRFLDGTFLIAPFPDHCLLLPLPERKDT